MSEDGDISQAKGSKKICRYLKRMGITFIDQRQDYYTKMLAKVRDVEKGKEN